MKTVYAPGEFLLPREGIDPAIFAVIACDQYTSEPEKWEAMDAAVGERPSALRLILPEARLGEAPERVPRIHEAMRRYLEEGIMVPRVKNGFVLTQRVTASGSRIGLVILIDLEAYDCAPDSVSPVRPTEGTVLERIPPRLRVRQGAPLELSHVMLLCDDPEDTVLGAAWACRDRLPLLYDTELMLSGGHLKGWAVEEGPCMDAVLKALAALDAKKGSGGILFAVGDGNHSLATARAYWDQVKEGLPEEQRQTHPARFASAELVNLYSPALIFEPIHRILFHTDPETVLAALEAGGVRTVTEEGDARVICGEKEIAVRFDRPLHPLPVGTVQACLDRAGGFETDYIHGEATLRSLAAQPGNVGILVPPMRKESLFEAVSASGPLPRKTFSMGEACEKRYYMEARRIL